jgi:cobalamin-dependent methionine synthase I
VLIIGESINGTIQKVGQAILERNETFLRELASTQFNCGAQMFDVNRILFNQDPYCLEYLKAYREKKILF